MIRRQIHLKSWKAIPLEEDFAGFAAGTLCDVGRPTCAGVGRNTTPSGLPRWFNGFCTRPFPPKTRVSMWFNDHNSEKQEVEKTELREWTLRFSWAKAVKPPPQGGWRGIGNHPDNLEIRPQCSWVERLIAKPLLLRRLRSSGTSVSVLAKIMLAALSVVTVRVCGRLMIFANVSRIGTITVLMSMPRRHLFWLTR